MASSEAGDGLDPLIAWEKATQSGRVGFFYKKQSIARLEQDWSNQHVFVIKAKNNSLVVYFKRLTLGCFLGFFGS